MKIWTSCSDVELIHPRDLVNVIKEEQVYSTVQQYAMSQPLIAAAPTFQGYGQFSSTPTQSFSRGVKQIELFKDKEYFILNSFMMDLHYHGRFTDNTAQSFEETIEDAAVECMNNFAQPTHAVVFNPNVVVVGEFHNDTVTFKTMSPYHGAVIVYMPNKFTVMYSPKPCPYFPVEPKYGQFVSNILIGQTMKRLDLV